MATERNEVPFLSMITLGKSSIQMELSCPAWGLTCKSRQFSTGPQTLCSQLPSFTATHDALHRPRPRFALNQRPSSDEEMSFLLCHHARIGHANPDP